MMLSPSEIKNLDSQHCIRQRCVAGDRWDMPRWLIARVIQVPSGLNMYKTWMRLARAANESARPWWKGVQRKDGGFVPCKSASYVCHHHVLFKRGCRSTRHMNDSRGPHVSVFQLGAFYSLPLVMVAGGSLPSITDREGKKKLRLTKSISHGYKTPRRPQFASHLMLPFLGS